MVIGLKLLLIIFLCTVSYLIYIIAILLFFKGATYKSKKHEEEIELQELMKNMKNKD